MRRLTLFPALTGLLAASAVAQPTSFTYQGQLKHAGLPLDGPVDMRFSLYDIESGGEPVAGPVAFDGTTLDSVQVTNGLFAVELDFGVGPLQQGGQWLEVEVRTPHDPTNTQIYTALSPRQHITAAPFALSVPGLATTETGVEVAGDIHTPGEVTASAFSSNSPLIFKVNPGNTECARFDDSNCYLGLGTTSPQARLHIGGTPGVDGIRFPDGSLQTSAAGIGGGDGFWSLSGANIYNNNGGNVGIGTAAPSVSFHLVGSPFSQVVARFDNPGAGTGGTWLTTGHTATGREWSFGVNSSDGGFDFFNNTAFTSVVRFSPQGDISTLGHLTLAPTSSPILYTGTGFSELNRYLLLINSPQFSSASGLKAGGVLVADSYGYANPGKNDLIVKGSVGIGTAAPISPLTIRTSDGIFVSGYGWIHTNGTQQLGSYVSAGGGWLGTRSNDPLHFFTNDSVPQMTLATTGRLGIGTQSPVCPLHAVSMQSGVSAVFGTASSGTANSGVYGASTASNGNGIIGEAHNGGSAYGVWGRSNNGIGGYFEGGSYALYANGRARVSVLEIAGADVAEKFPAREAKVEAGTVMEIDPDETGRLRIARHPYSTRVAGVVSGAGNIPTGTILGNLPGSEDSPAIALSGRVWVRCDATADPIAPGDLLTSSDTAGHAMRAVDRERSHGAILGKAMSSLERGERGLVLVLVNLQ